MPMRSTPLKPGSHAAAADEEDFAAQCLRRCRLFRDLSGDLVTAIVHSMARRRYRRGEVIFHQDDPGDALHIVARGRVKIVLTSAEGDEAIVATVRPGDFFGELTLIDGAPRSATATAVDRVETLVLARERFRELLEANPVLRDNLEMGLAAEVRRMNEHVEELHFLDLEGRIAAHLARLVERETPGARGAVELAFEYSQGDLAAMIGGARQSVNRVLRGLEREGLVRIEGDRLFISDVAALEARAGL
jgi:CRP/FNR family cyclic AMP-dependent transcriptional regulator